MYIGECIKCDKGLYEGDVAGGLAHTDRFYCKKCWELNQPERSKREDGNPCKGTTLEEFLKEEGILDECTDSAKKRITDAVL